MSAERAKREVFQASGDRSPVSERTIIRIIVPVTISGSNNPVGSLMAGILPEGKPSRRNARSGHRLKCAGRLYPSPVSLPSFCLSRSRPPHSLKNQPLRRKVQNHPGRPRRNPTKQNPRSFSISRAPRETARRYITRPKAPSTGRMVPRLPSSRRRALTRTTLP
jgi:hypothetical protein